MGWGSRLARPRSWRIVVRGSRGVQRSERGPLVRSDVRVGASEDWFIPVCSTVAFSSPQRLQSKGNPSSPRTRRFMWLLPATSHLRLRSGGFFIPPGGHVPQRLPDRTRLTTADDCQKPCRYPQRHARTAAPPLPPPPPLAVGQVLRGPNNGSACRFPPKDPHTGRVALARQHAIGRVQRRQRTSRATATDPRLVPGHPPQSRSTYAACWGPTAYRPQRCASSAQNDAAPRHRGVGVQ